MTPRRGGYMSGPVPETTICWLWGFIWGAVIMAVLLGLVWVSTPARAASFYPACLKPDGDWLHGVTPHECRQLRGRWYTADVLRKARKVW